MHTIMSSIFFLRIWRNVKMAENKRYQEGHKLDTVKLIEKRFAVPKVALVEDERVSSDMRNKNQRLQIDKLRAMVEKTIEKVNDGTGILELLPDLNLIREILVATILAPKDLTEVKLSITSNDNRVPPRIAELVREHLTTNYDLESAMSDIVGEALFDIGSHIRMPLPASGLFNVMQSHSHALESLNHTNLRDIKLPDIGIIDGRSSDKLMAMESISASFIDGDKKLTGQFEIPKGQLEIVDNPLYLLGPTLLKVTQRVNVKNRLAHIGMEGIEYRSNDEKDIYQRKTYDFIESVILKKEDMSQVGVNLDPIVMKLPAESVIVVFVPGEPDNHVGYYIILDDYGYPIQGSKNRNFFKELNDKLENTITSGSNMIIKNSQGIREINEHLNASFIRQPMTDAYIFQIEEELRKGVSNGVHGANVEISRPAELFRLMFARQMQKMRTRALYVPAEMLTYFAFEHDEMGMGVSLIEKTKLYSSLRAILMFAEVMAGIKNSVPGRTLSIALDEADPDPQGTIETILDAFSAMQTSGLPLGKLNPSEIVDGIVRANVNVKVDGGEVFPNTNIDIEERRRDMNKPDTELNETLKKQQYSGMGVSPELADRGLEGEFATGITQANLLQAKRIMVYQDKFNYLLTDHMHKYIFAGGPLFAAVKKEWENIKGDDKPTFEETISALKCELPKPDTAVITAQSTAYEEYSKFIETAVATHINEDMMRNLLKGEYSQDAVASIQQAIINLLKRQYMRKQNMLPEIDELLTDKDGGIVDAINQHNDNILNIISGVLPVIYKNEYEIVDKKTAEAIREVEEKKQKDNPDGMPDTGGGSSYDSGSDDNSDTGEDTGDDDFDMGDLGMDEEEPAVEEETTDTEDTEAEKDKDTTDEEPEAEAEAADKDTAAKEEPKGDETEEK